MKMGRRWWWHVTTSLDRFFSGDYAHLASNSWPILKVEDGHMAVYEWGWILSGRRGVDKNIGRCNNESWLCGSFIEKGVCV